MKYRILVNRTKLVSNELKFLSCMSLKMFTFFTSIFRYSWCRCHKKFRGYRTLICFVNYSENHRIFMGGSMGKIKGRGMPNILLFVLYGEG